MSWKGKTVEQIFGMIEKNKKELKGDNIMNPPPLVIYRRELKKNTLGNIRKNRPIYFKDIPGSYTKVNENECIVDTEIINKKNQHCVVNCEIENARKRVRNSNMFVDRYRSGSSAPISYSSSSQLLKSRNKSYDQNTFSNIRYDEQVKEPYNSTTVLFCNSKKFAKVEYNPNNTRFSQQGAVDSSSQISRLKHDTIVDVHGKHSSANGILTENALSYNNSMSGYTIKEKIGYPNICSPNFC